MRKIEYDLLLAVYEHYQEHGYSPTNQKLSEMTGIDPKRVGISLKNLRREGYVTYCPNTKDNISILHYEWLPDRLRPTEDHSAIRVEGVLSQADKLIGVARGAKLQIGQPENSCAIQLATDKYRDLGIEKDD